jgi:integrase
LSFPQNRTTNGLPVSALQVVHIVVTYTPEQANQLLNASLGDRLEAMYILMLTTACRLGELLGLRWSAVNLERGELQVATTLKEISSHRSLSRPKPPRARRTIPLTPLAAQSLKRNRIQQMGERLAHGADWNPHDLVSMTTHGTANAQTNWRTQQYIPMINKAGLPYIRPHDLRHTAATLLLLEGLQPLVISEMVGHVSVAFTLARYGHLQAEMRKPARDAMKRLFGGIFA